MHLKQKDIATAIGDNNSASEVFNKTEIDD